MTIQALRGVAALAVLFAHMSLGERIYGGGDALLPKEIRLGEIGVDLFFVISGFIMVHVTMAYRRDIGSCLRFFYNRAARIYPLYWVVTIAFFLMTSLRGMLGGDFGSGADVVKSLLLIPQHTAAWPERVDPILSVGWSLLHEVYFYLVFGLLLLASRRVQPVLLALWGLAISIGVYFGLDHQNAYFDVMFSPLTFEFLAGCVIAYAVHNKRFLSPWFILAAGVGVLCVQALFFFDDLYREALIDRDQRIIIFGIPCALILYGAAVLEQRDSIRAPTWLIAIGNMSFTLYLVHTPVIRVVGLVNTKLGGPGLFDNFLMHAATLALVAAATVATHRLVEKPLLNMTKEIGKRLNFEAIVGARPANQKAW